MDELAHIYNRKVCLAANGRHSQAIEACTVLRGIKGVYEAEPVSENSLTLSYSLEYLTFDIIEALLKELGFYLDTSVMAMVRRNIYQYLEDNAREKMHMDRQKQALAGDTDTSETKEEPEKYWNDYR